MQPLYHRIMTPVQRLAHSLTARRAALVAGANGASATVRFAVLLVLAGVFTQAEYAYLGIFVAVMDTASVVTESGLHPTLVRFLAGQRGSRRDLLRRVLVIKSALVLLCVGGAFLGYGLFRATQGIPGDLLWMFPAAVGAGILLSFHMLAMAFLQALQRFALYAMVSISINLLRLVLIVAAIFAGYAAFPLLAALFLAAPAIGAALGCLVAVTAARRTPQETKPDAPGAKVASYGPILTFMLPLAAVQWLVIAVERGDIWVMQALTNPEATADLVLAKQASLLFPIAATALWTVLLPKVSALEGRAALERYRRQVLRLAPLGLLLALAAMAVVPPALNFLLGGRYATAMPVMAVIFLGYGISLMQNPLGLIFYAVNRTHYIPLMHLLQVPVFFAICIPLAPRLGAMAAAIAYLVIRALAMIYSLIVTARVVQQLPDAAPSVAAEDPPTVEEHRP